MIATPLLRDYLLEQAINQHDIAAAAYYYDSTWENVSVLRLDVDVNGTFFIITIDKIGMFEVDYIEHDFKGKFDQTRRGWPH